MELTQKNKSGHLPVSEMRYLHDRLEQIRLYLEKEIDLRQRTIDKQLAELDNLRTIIGEKNAMVQHLKTKLHDCEHHTEGNRQLINKLLGDIEHYQNDIEWYKRTYEKRSIWGIIKDKLGRKS